jgi:hypothetical protein
MGTEIFRSIESSWIENNDAATPKPENPEAEQTDGTPINRRTSRRNAGVSFAR